MVAIRKRIKRQHRNAGFVPSKPWTPRPTFYEQMTSWTKLFKAQAHSDIKTLISVGDMWKQTNEKLKEMKPLFFGLPRRESWMDELHRLIAARRQSEFAQRPKNWELTEHIPNIDGLLTAIKGFAAQPVDKMILPSLVYDAIAKSTVQPCVTLDNGSFLTMSIEPGGGYDETAGLIVRRYPDGDVEILHRFKVERDA